MKRIITNLLDGGVFQPDFDLCRRLARESLAVASPGRRVMIWSAEELCKGPLALHRARAANLRAVFGACRIMITLRHPVKHVESEYLQSLKIAHVGRNWDRYKTIGLFDVQTRLDELWSQGEENDLSKLLYAKTIAAYREVFGREAMGVFLFEELLHDPRRYVSRLCEFLGIDPHQGWALCDGRRENNRWTVDQFRRLRKIERSGWRRAIFRRASLRWRRRLLGLDADTGDPSRRAPKVEVQVPFDWRKRIEDLTREGNGWLAQEWSLPMAKYGYPL